MESSQAGGGAGDRDILLTSKPWGVIIGDKKGDKDKKKDEKKKTEAETGDLLVFTAVDPLTREGKMLIWDEDLGDTYAVPAFGTDLNPGASIFQKTRIAFDRRTGGIFFYDLLAETLGEFNDVNQTGFTQRPSITGDGKMMTFVSNPDGLPDFRPGVTRGFVWIDGAVAELPNVNETADPHGGVGRVRLAGKGGGAGTFATLDGGIFLFDLFSGVVTEITDARWLVDGFGHHPVLSGDAKRLAFVVGRTAPQQIYVMDLAEVDTPAGKAHVPASQPEPLVYANTFIDTPIATAPRFTGRGRIYFEAFHPGLEVFKAFHLDPVRGVQMLTAVNATIPDEAAVYSGTGVP